MDVKNQHKMPTQVDYRAAEGDVVITGVSCRLPESDNMAEFWEHLVAGDDMTTSDNRRWETGFLGLPEREGKLKDLTKFDASFFGVHPKQANVMDPQLRILLEVAYEAIVDSGYNPTTLRGTRTGVFVGISSSEAAEVWGNVNYEHHSGYNITGCSRSMIANRLSFFFDFKGPSYAVDTACSSSFMALDQARDAILSGKCDSAIVGGCNICINPGNALGFLKLGVVSPDGRCKSFDASANGYCRSEGVVAIHLQKVSSARRVYCSFLHSKTLTGGYTEEGILHPSGNVQEQLLLETYREAGIDPRDVDYVEAHGTGTQVGDTVELNTITDVFCKNRTRALLVGSTKSNMGHPEGAAGLAALAKVILAIGNGTLPANLHFKNPNPKISGLFDGRLKVVSENVLCPGGLIGINSFGFGGVNVHAVFRHNHEEEIPVPVTKPRLCVLSGRTEDSVSRCLRAVLDNNQDSSLQALLKEQSCLPSLSFPFRGFCVTNNGKDSLEVKDFSNDNRPVWFVFSGMGSQWTGMGRQMMVIEKFQESICALHAVMIPYGLDLLQMLTGNDPHLFETPLNSFVAIVSIQIALVDTLFHMGITPDGIVGHSVGELACAYADGCLTSTEALLAAYWRGRCLQEADLPPGAMAAIGLTWAEAKRQCPKGVTPACHNAVDSVTVSGSAGAVSDFVKVLKDKGVFAKEVDTSGVAFHSSYMKNVAPALKSALDKVITTKPRSSKWISSSIAETNWASPLAQYSSSDYHVNNLVSPVLFHEALQHVPDNAIVLEIAPHCLLQAILKRSLSQSCHNAGLMSRKADDGLAFFYSSLGKCYMEGLDFQPHVLYEAVKYPVPSRTPMISQHLKWNHSQTWDVPTADDFVGKSSVKSGALVVDVDIDADDSYLSDHRRDGTILYPAAGYVVLAWKALARLKGLNFQDLPVHIENVTLFEATVLLPNEKVTFVVNIMPATGNFEITESDQIKATGHISALDPAACPQNPAENTISKRDLSLSTSDVYKLLQTQGFDYGSRFKGILKSTYSGDEAQLLWQGNWVVYLDLMLQLQMISSTVKGVPSRIRSIKINSGHHDQQTNRTKDTCLAYFNKNLNSCKSKGVEIQGVHVTPVPRRTGHLAPILEQYVFVPNDDNLKTRMKPELREYAEDCLAYTQKCIDKVLTTNGFHTLPMFSELEVSTRKRTAVDKGKMLSHYQQNSCGIMKVLHSVFTTPLTGNIQKAMSTSASASTADLSRDRLFQVIRGEYSLKPCIDVVLENCEASSANIIEVCSGSHTVYKQIQSHIENQTHLQIKYTLTHENGRGQQDDHNVDRISWNLKNKLSSPSQPDLIIMDSALNLQDNITTALCSAVSSCKTQGFLLVIEPTMNFPMHRAMTGFQTHPILDSRTHGPFLDSKAWRQMFLKHKLEIVCEKSDGFLFTLFLLRKPKDVFEKHSFLKIDDQNYSWVDKLKAGLHEVSDNTWFCSSSSVNGVLGLTKCLNLEPDGGHFRCIQSDVPLHQGSEIFRTLLRQDLCLNVLMDGKLGTYRQLPLSHGDATERVDTRSMYVDLINKGDLTSLRWVQSNIREDSPDACAVHYAALNFRDVMLATGKLPPDAIPCINDGSSLGMEFSGMLPSGRRVMGILPGKAMATTVIPNNQFLWEVPKSWSLEEAATVPVVYATAYYALVHRGRITRGDVVLIHSGSGGVGQAAISLALHYGCRVYTTVSSKVKKEYLMKKFPTLKERNFSNSRDGSFEKHILQETEGKGVDVVLNSLAEHHLQASLRVLAVHGRFLEIGKFDLAKNSQMGMAPFLRNISFHGVHLDSLFDGANKEWPEVYRLLNEGIRSGVVRPLTSTVFLRTEVEHAFRHMGHGLHIGKVLIKMRSDKGIVKPVAAEESRTYCSPHKSYVIVGGLGGFGLELAKWLIVRGARKLVLSSRHGVKTGYQSLMLRNWKDDGILATIATDDVGSPTGARKLLATAASLGPVGGVFNLAVVLRDGLTENQTIESFQEVCHAKVKGTRNIDLLTRSVPYKDDLDLFVVFSSVCVSRGVAGQTNYAFANSTMEKIVEQRHADGLPGSAIQWGGIDDVGVLVEVSGRKVVAGTEPQKIHSCLESLDRLLNSSHPVVTCYVPAVQDNVQARDTEGCVVESVGRILGINDFSKMNMDTTLQDMGLDSLMGAEVRQLLQRSSDTALSMQEIRELTLAKLRGIGRKRVTSERRKSTRLQIVRL